MTGMPRLKKNLKEMLGKYPNIYWIACYLVATPVITAAIFIMAIVANSEVTLNKQPYPTWAHVIGWLIVTLVLIPIPIGLFLELRRANYDFKKASLVSSSTARLKLLAAEPSCSFARFSGRPRTGGLRGTTTKSVSKGEHVRSLLST